MIDIESDLVTAQRNRIVQQTAVINRQAQTISDLLIAAETMYNLLQRGHGVWTIADQGQAAEAIEKAKGQPQ